MKKILLTSALSLCLPLFASAASLKQNMKELGGLFKQIAQSYSDTSQNATNAERATKMLALLQTVRGQTPDSIANHPPNQHENALKEYQRLIEDEITFANQIRGAFQSNDNKFAASLYNQMNSTKRDGHNKFN